MGLSRGPERSWQRPAVCSGVWQGVAVCGGVCLGKRASLGGGASLSSFPLRRILLSLRCPLRLSAPRFSLHADPFAPQRRHRNAEKTQLRRCFTPTSRDTWAIVEIPLAHARGYRQSKTQMTWGSLGGGASLSSFPLRRILLSLRCPLRLSAPRFSLHADPFAPQRRYRNAERTLLRRCFTPTSRDSWAIVEIPLAGARGYRQSKNQMTWGLDAAAGCTPA